MAAGCERTRELRRRRKRAKTFDKIKAKLPKASASLKTEYARKLRGMTAGAEQLITDWKLVEQKDR